MTELQRPDHQRQQVQASPAGTRTPGARKSLSKKVEKCAICKNGIQNRATLETCFHSYCFQCIIGWSKNPQRRASCPRCEKPYQNILHNIQRDTTFEVYQVPENEYALESKVEIQDDPDCCSICLEDFEDRSSVETCLHSFCFKCITDWAKTRMLCPLCNGKFDTVYHNIKNDLTYEEYKIKRTNENEILPEQHQPEIADEEYEDDEENDTIDDNEYGDEGDDDDDDEDDNDDQDDDDEGNGQIDEENPVRRHPSFIIDDDDDDDDDEDVDEDKEDDSDID